MKCCVCKYDDLKKVSFIDRLLHKTTRPPFVNSVLKTEFFTDRVKAPWFTFVGVDFDGRSLSYFVDIIVCPKCGNIRAKI